MVASSGSSEKPSSGVLDVSFVHVINVYPVFRVVYSCSDTFFAAALVVSAVPDTCVEFWQVRGDSYHLLSSQYLELSQTTHMYRAALHQDLTGVMINASKPIGVYAGHSCAFVPENVSYCDHISEQIPPVSELGHTHVVPPIIGRNPDSGSVVLSQLEIERALYINMVKITLHHAAYQLIMYIQFTIHTLLRIVVNCLVC